jgi:hypothetical protein
MDGEVRFATAADRAAFAEELGTSLRDLVAQLPRREARPAAAGTASSIALHPSLKSPENHPKNQ